MRGGEISLMEPAGTEHGERRGGSEDGQESASTLNSRAKGPFPRDWHLSFGEDARLRLRRSRGTLRLAIEGSVLGGSGRCVLPTRKAPDCDIALVSDTKDGVRFAEALPPATRIVVVGRFRLLSLAQDREVYDRASSSARALLARAKLRLAPTESTSIAAWFDEIEFALMHELVPALRPLCEIAALCRDEAIREVILPSTAFLAARALRDLLIGNAWGKPETPPGRWIASACRLFGRGTGRTRTEFTIAADASIVLLDSRGRRRPSARPGFERLLAGLSERAVVAVVPIGTEPSWLRSPPGPRTAWAWWRVLREVGFPVGMAARLLLRVLRFAVWRVPDLIAIAEAMLRASSVRSMAVIAPNPTRSPVVFALAGAHRADAATFAMQTMLVTKDARYGRSEADGTFLVDEGQALALLTSNHPDASTPRAVGSCELDIRCEEAAAARLGRTPSTIVVCMQPSFVEMEAILALFEVAPPGLPIRIALHPEDGPATRWRLRALMDRADRDITFASGDGEPLADARVLVTATSNMAVVGARLGISTILVARPTDLGAVWASGPYPGIVVDPEREDFRRTYQAALMTALSMEGTAADYLRVNAKVFGADAGQHVLKQVEETRDHRSRNLSGLLFAASSQNRNSS